MEVLIQYKRGGNDMKRLIIFKKENDSYVLKENGKLLFEINISDMKFNSLKFYEGVYKDESSNIELQNMIENDDRLGKYIFKWLDEIISQITNEFNEAENDVDIDIEVENIVIPLFELSACAGNGHYMDSDVPFVEYSTCNVDADFAVKISGKSMEPTIIDGSTVLVKKTCDRKDGDIYIFSYEGETMCKRLNVLKKSAKLVPDNVSGNFKTITSSQMKNCFFQGKVIEIIPPKV